MVECAQQSGTMETVSHRKKVVLEVKGGASAITVGSDAERRICTSTLAVICWLGQVPYRRLTMDSQRGFALPAVAVVETI